MESAKIVNLQVLLHEGDPNGIVTIRNNAWQDGEITICNRREAKKIDSNIFRGGAYILVSQFMCAIFPLTEFVNRIESHLNQEKWWYKVAIISSQGRNLSETESLTLVSLLREKARSLDCLLYDDELDKTDVDTFQKVSMEQFSESATQLLNLLGINVLEKKKNGISSVELVHGLPNTSFIKACRSESSSYVKAQGIPVSDHFSYASKRNNGEYWINSTVETLKKDWTIIFHDPDVGELLIAQIPAYTLMTATKNRPGLLVRPDKNCVDVGIDCASFIDRKSGIDFAPFLIKRIKY